LFSEPQGGPVNWVLFLIVTASVAIWPIIDSGFFTQFGALLLTIFSISWFESLAEVLPKKQWKLAGCLRILGWVVFLGGLVYFSYSYITFRTTN
jgi:hypothetical protein